MQRFQRFVSCAVLALVLTISALVDTAAVAALDCDTTQSITSNFTLTENYEKDGTGPCFTVDAPNVTVNLAGYSIVCETAGGCTNGIVVNANGVTIRNGNIVGGMASRVSVRRR